MKKKFRENLEIIKFVVLLHSRFGRHGASEEGRKVHKKFLVVEDMEGSSSLSFSGGRRAGARRRPGEFIDVTGNREHEQPRRETGMWKGKREGRTGDACGSRRRRRT